jgi:carbon-monoxide dehydrogenase iron sulfur subunit
MSEFTEESISRLSVIPDRCTGCQICLLACSFQHKDIFRPYVARLKVSIKRNFLDQKKPEVFDQPFVCLQCNPPPCGEACPEYAISVNDQVVEVDENKCDGCGLCVPACPYDVIDLDPDTGLAYKCDLCGGAPQCASSCPSGAITYIFVETQL